MTDVLRQAVDRFLDTCRDEWVTVDRPTPHEKRKKAMIENLEGNA